MKPKRINEGVSSPVFYSFSLILLAIILFFLSNYKVRDPDIWMYLKTGELTVRNLHPVLKDVFSYTHPGGEWVNHSWLSQVVFSGFYRLLGLGGLYLARYLLLGGTFGLVFLNIEKNIGRRGAIWLTFLSMAAGSQRFVIRPELFTFLLLAGLLFLLERTSRRGRSLLALPLLFLFWSNLHGGFILGLGFLFLFCLGEGAMLLFRFPRSRAEDGNRGEGSHPANKYPRLLLISLISAGACLLNPNGLKVFGYSYRIQQLSSFIYVWQPFSFANWQNWPVSLFLFPLFLLLTLISYLANWRKTNLSHLLIFIAGSVLALKAVRNIFLFAIVAPPLLAYNLRGYLGAKLENRWITRLTPAILLLISLGILLSPKWERDPFARDIHREFGWGISPVSYPLAGADFIEKHHLRERIFNSFGIGNFLSGRLWPGQKVYVDGRLSVYGTDFLLNYNRILTDPSFFPEEAIRWNFKIAIVDHPNPSNSSLLKWLEGDLNWKLAFFDANSALYLRDIPPGKTPLPPADLTGCLEVARMSPREIYAKASFLLLIGRTEEAIPLLSHLGELYPRSPSVYTRLARAYLIRREWEEAESACRKALSLGGEKSTLLLILAHLHFINERIEEAIAAGEKALKLAPGRAQDYQMLGDAYRARGEAEKAAQSYRRGSRGGSDPELIIKLAELYFSEGDYQLAAEWYSRIPPNSNFYGRAQVYLAGCYGQLRDYPQAQALYQNCAERFPEYSQLCFFNLAEINLREGRETEARRWLEKITDPAIRIKIEASPDLRSLSR